MLMQKLQFIILNYYDKQNEVIWRSYAKESKGIEDEEEKFKFYHKNLKKSRINYRKYSFWLSPLGNTIDILFPKQNSNKR